MSKVRERLTRNGVGQEQQVPDKYYLCIHKNTEKLLALAMAESESTAKALLDEQNNKMNIANTL
ncbi:hypothetical protein QTV49_004197 [Vibrio vulnificus]|nr:hypothetical protein [Vibrio vulnificus]